MEKYTQIYRLSQEPPVLGSLNNVQFPYSKSRHRTSSGRKRARLIFLFFPFSIRGGGGNPKLFKRWDKGEREETCR